jgi:hypothetical protein
MSKWFKLGVVALLAVGALGALVSGIAFAQGATSTPSAGTTTTTKLDRGFGHNLGSQAALEAAAKALGMTVNDLKTQLWGGKTLADLAEEKGVALADVKAAVEAAQKEEQRASIEQAVTDGKITRENADWLLEGLDKGYLNSLKYFGGMGGRGGRGGHGFGGFMDNDANTTSPSTTTTP